MAHPRQTVVYFTNSLARGGAEEHLLTLLTGLDRSRFRAFLVCPPELHDQLIADIPTDVVCERILLDHPVQLGAVYKLARFFLFARPSVVHSHMFCSSVFASPLARLCGVRVVVETPHIRESWRSGSRYVVDRLVSRFIDYYIAVSKANEQYLVTEKRLPPSKIAVIHNGCDIGRFAQRGSGVEALRHRLGVPLDIPVVVVAARLEPQKGHGILLRAMQQVKTRLKDTYLVCVGDGSLRAALEEDAAALGLVGNVRFVGRQSNVPDWLHIADVVALPSFFEGLPLIAIEALAAGRPVVATAVDGTCEIIINGKTGVTVPPGDPAALAAALLRLLTNPEFAGRLASSGREWVADQFTAEGQVRATEALYFKALRRRGVSVALEDAACAN